MTITEPTGLPIHDRLVADRAAAKAAAEGQAVRPQEPDSEVKSALATEAITNLQPEKNFLVLNEYSPQAQVFAKKINDAIAGISRTVEGMSFVDYVNYYGKSGDIPAHELPKLSQEVALL